MAEGDRVPEGIYRDGRYLVVDLRGSQFPFRCVKTNRPVGYYIVHEIRCRRHAIIASIAVSLWFAAYKLVRWELTIKYGVRGTYFSAAFILVTYWILTRVIRRSHFLRVSMHEEYVERRKRTARIGWRLALGGLFGLMIVVLLQVTAALNGLVSSSDAAVNGLSVALALLALSGFPFLIIAHFPILRRRKLREPFVWLAGANRDFLASLPAWELRLARDSN